MRRAEGRVRVPPGGVRVGELDFRISKPQVVHDGWRRRDRVCRFTGLCVTCARRTYEFDDGENDPRGMLGDHACSPLSAEEYGMVGPDVPLCAICANEEGTYRYALEQAKRRRWRPLKAPGVPA